MLEEAGFAILTALAASSVAWFFSTRRAMIRWLRDTALNIESVFKPRDKTYEYLGYLVGFRVVLEPGLGWLRGASILYTQSPRHSLLYLPVVLAKKCRERLDVRLLVAEPRWGRGRVECNGCVCIREGDGRVIRALRVFEEACSDARRAVLEYDGERGELRVRLCTSGPPSRRLLEAIVEAARLLSLRSRV